MMIFENIPGERIMDYEKKFTRAKKALAIIAGLHWTSAGSMANSYQLYIRIPIHDGFKCWYQHFPES